MNHVTRFAAFSLAALALSACATHVPPASELDGSVALPALPPAGEPEWISGLNAEMLEAQFGHPAFVRKDGGAQIWRYDGASCKAFFFLYSSASGMAVKHVETLPRGTTMAADANCLAALRHPPVS